MNDESDVVDALSLNSSSSNTTSTSSSTRHRNTKKKIVKVNQLAKIALKHVTKRK
jgi:hypothetical protein